MEIDSIVTEVVEDLRRAGAIGGEETARVAELLVAGIEPSLRLHLLEALHAAAQELEASAPGFEVEVRLEGRDPVLSVVHAAPDAESPAGAEAETLGGYADDELLRLTLRLPQGLKLRVEHAAAGAGASLNSWIVAALARSLEPSASSWLPSRRLPKRMTGFVQG